MMGLVRSKWLVTAAALAWGLASLASATAQLCPISGTGSPMILFQSAHYMVVAKPSNAVVVDLSTGYPPPPGRAAPYVYDTNFHRAAPGTPENALHVRVCPIGVSATTTWELQLSLDDLFDSTTNSQIPADEFYYDRKWQGNWTAASNTPTSVYTQTGPVPKDLYFYFQARLSGTEAAGVYQGALHFAVFATTP